MRRLTWGVAILYELDRITVLSTRMDSVTARMGFVTVGHPLGIIASVAVVSALAGCMSDAGDLAVASASLGAACAAPALGGGAACDLGNGRLGFQVTLPKGQQYVEVFARQNGIQNVAVAIQGSAVDHGDGTATYAFVRDGYRPGDLVEYRFYSYLPRSPGVFTPGPIEWRWYLAADAGTTNVRIAKDATVVYTSLGTGPAADRNFGSETGVTIGEYHITSEGLFGYELPALREGGAITHAEWVIPTAHAPGGPVAHLRLNRIAAPWWEGEVTWNTRPPYAFLGEIGVTSDAETRIDVTDEVAAAVAGDGALGFALQPSTALPPTIDNIFLDSRETSGGKPPYLAIEWQ